MDVTLQRNKMAMLVIPSILFKGGLLTNCCKHKWIWSCPYSIHICIREGSLLFLDVSIQRRCAIELTNRDWYCCGSYSGWEEGIDNLGVIKYFQSGPMWQWTKSALSYLCLRNGGITGQNLVHLLTKHYKMELFQYALNDPILVLIVDNHLPAWSSFVLYINDKSCCWKFCLGILYVTLLWQVGDARGKNGSFKQRWYE